MKRIAADRRPAGPQSASNLFQEAMHLEEVVGDLPAAIRLYQRVVEEFSTQRPLAADALVRMGQCYEKLGDTQARAAYQRAVSDYPDQLTAAAEARSRLAFLQTGDEADRSPGIVARQVWPAAPIGSDDAVLGSISPDGRYVAFVNWGVQAGGPDLPPPAGLGVYDTETGRARLLANYAEVPVDYVTGMAWSRDGARIAYSQWPNTDYTHEELRVVRADGSDDHLLFADVERPIVRPMAWSRDGDFIVCRLNFWDGVERIGTVSTEDGTVQTLKTLGPHRALTLSLSPDDKYIVYAYPQEADDAAMEVPGDPETDVAVHDVFILATDGSGEVRLVAHAANDERPFWTPDGGRVVFLSDRSGRRGLYAVEVRDGRPVGDPELIRPDAGPMVTLGFGRSGALYYKLDVTSTDVYVAELDLNGTGTLGEPSPLTDRWEGANTQPSWSPDGSPFSLAAARATETTPW